MNDPRGSTWRKWDLQVHTPESLVHQYVGTDPWAPFIQELEQLPPEFKVIGINDYIFLDGYKRIIAEKAKGRLANIDLFLPVIELRLDKFGGSQGHLARINYHIIFSDELTPDLIEQQFLNALSSKYVLTPQYDHFRTGGKWAALPTKQSLTDLGNLIISSVPEKERGKFGSPLTEGFNNLCLNRTNILEALNSPYFKGKFVTAIGKTEWADVKWNDHTIAEKKTIINETGFVFISAAKAEDWTKAKESLRSAGVNDRLLDCSDAHYFSDATQKDRVGNCFTWIKADTTFRGLLQVLNEPNDRVFVGDLPPKLGRIRDNATKYIDSIRVQRKPTATLSEIWFDNTIPLNADLVAIVGNKGKGKSALTDIIGLLCNTKQHGDFTFLSPDNFRQPKENKAKHFQATLTWKSGVPVSKGLEESVDEQQPELVKYIPQNFLEKICTQLGKIEESDFDRELKKVIFSHVEPADRLGTASLDDLIVYKASEANKRILILKQELRKINEGVVAFEEKTQPEFRQKIENLLVVKRQELEAHEKAKPGEVPKPENNPTTAAEIAQTAAAIEAAKQELAESEKQITSLNEEQSKLVQLISVTDRLIARLDNFSRQLDTLLAESRTELANINISADSILKISIDKQPLLDKRRSLVEQKTRVDERLDPLKPTSVVQAKVGIQKRIEELQAKLDEPNRKYQAYETALRAWEKRRSEILGSQDSIGTLKYHEVQLENLKQIPQQLDESRRQRLLKAKEIYAVIGQLASTYRELYAPVNHFIEQRPLAREKFQLNFDVGIVDTGFLEDFFEMISHGAMGTFCGVEEGRKALKDLLARCDFNTESGIQNFLNEIIDSLQSDKRPGGQDVRVTDQLRKGKTVLTLYDMIFSLAYLKPRYALRMGDKELHQLSPGERGTLLLVFYLLIDKDDIPLVIDQPEENLDNQTVYELLVPAMKEAKQRRQVFIVTHNPNLAVVCDAEQIICADLDKKQNYRMAYLSGAIENPATNKAIVDILEGTMPAFDNRDSKYF